MWQDSKLLTTAANFLFGVCALLLLLSGLWVLAHQPLFTLKVIQVVDVENNAPRHVNAEIIRSTAVPRIKGNFFTANLDTVRHAFELVPWVRKASVRREWPDRLIVKLEEHSPLGIWGEEGQLLSVKGEVFTANLAEAEEDTRLLEFSGPVGSEKEVWSHYVQFKDWFNTVGLKPESVAYSKRYAWLVKMDTGMVVQLGREENSDGLKKRVDQLLRVYPELTNRLQGKIESVDLRYPNGLALKATGQELNVVVKQKK